MSRIRSTAWRPWLIWTACFLSFPAAGVAAGATAGRVDSLASALVAGLITGAVIGVGQSLASSRRLDPRRWIPATTAGTGLGLALGAWAADYDTSLSGLATMGALTGLVLGSAQALALPVPARHRAGWAALISALWSLGWTITTLAGVDVAQQFSVFGSTGAITVSALSGLVLQLILPAHPAPSRHPIGDLA